MTGFFTAIDAIVVPAVLVSIDAVLDAYFKPAPAFAGSGKKKAEFPDAFALMSPETWAKEHNASILADSGRRLDLLPTTEDALSARE